MTDNLTNINNRVPLFKALVGSHNYNLNTPESDKDYKLFVLPTFDDLYSNQDYTHSISSDKEDIVMHDIRKLSSLFYKANVNYIEVLYSKDLEILLPKEHKSYEDLKEILNQREEICKMNMPYLFHACKGMYHNKRKMMSNKGKDHIDSLGYAPKHAMGAYRIMDFLTRYKHFIETNVEHPFQLAIDYFYEKEREELLNIRNGIYSLDQIESILDTKYKRTIVACEDYYLSQTVNDKLKDWLDNKLKKIVKDNM